jgi:dihydroxyacid dehydratase/phosphogluconate dehydratase
MVMRIVVINFRGGESSPGMDEVTAPTDGLGFYSLAICLTASRRLVPRRRTDVATCGLA